jgi:hypothetical protein
LGILGALIFIEPLNTCIIIFFTILFF